MGLFDNVDWKDLKDKAVSATNKAIDVTKDAVESAKKAKAEADVKKRRKSWMSAAIPNFSFCDQIK